MSWHFSAALTAAYANSHSSPEQGGGFSAVTYSGGGASAQSSLTPTHGMFWCPDRTTDASRRSRSGMMYEPLTGTHGEELLTWFQEGFRVKTSLLPGRERDLAESGRDSGRRWHGSFARYDPDTSSWKTPQLSLVADLELFSETWPRWGTMQNGECWARSMPELPTAESASGLWATPCAQEQGMIVPERADELGWEWRGTAYYDAKGVKKNSSLTHQVRRFPTPVANDAKKAMPPSEAKRNSLTGAMVRMYPTPTAQDAKNSTLPLSLRERDSLPGFLLRSGGEQTRQTWPTPRASADTLNGGLGHRQKLQENGLTGSDRYALNPNWVEWLMGFPIGWSDCGDSGTRRFQAWCVSHGIP